jgi:hypothetical protein
MAFTAFLLVNKTLAVKAVKSKITLQKGQLAEVKNNREATRSNLSSRSLNKNLLFFTFSDITFHQSFPVLIMKEAKVVAVHFYLLNIKKHALVTIYLLAIGVTPESPHKPACNQ